MKSNITYRVFLLILALFSFVVSTAPAVSQSAGGAEIKEEKKVSIRWGKVERAAAYEYRITRPDGTVVVRTRVKNNEATLSLVPGQYFLEVAAVSSGGNLSEWSKKQTLTVYPSGSPEERNARLQVIETLSNELSQKGAESELGNLGLGKVNMFGGGFDLTAMSVDKLDPFDSYIGGHIYFRYYKLFLTNLKPELRIGFLSSYNTYISDRAGLSMIKIYGYLGYSIPMFNNTFFIVPQIGSGIHYMNLSTNSFGRWYLNPGAAACVELSFQPFEALRIFARAEYIFFWLDEAFTVQVEMFVPSIGLALRF